MGRLNRGLTLGLLLLLAPRPLVAESGLEKSETPQPAPPDVLDAKALSELALEHSRARDALAAAEARLSLLFEKVFRSRLTVLLRNDMDTPFRLERVELDLDGALAFVRDFEKAASAEALKLFDGALPPGRHVVAMRIFARGPDDPEGVLPGYFAGSGMTVHVREKARCELTFVAEADGDSPGAGVQKEAEPDGKWAIEVTGRYETVSP